MIKSNFSGKFQFPDFFPGILRPPVSVPKKVTESIL